MCGIVGYVGPSSALEVLIGGLKRLEYRGYDSAGVSLISETNGLETRKRAGKLAVLVQELSDFPITDAHIGIGHTRWATHGAPLMAMPTHISAAPIKSCHLFTTA